MRKALAICAALMLALPVGGPPLAQDIEPLVIVPEHPQGIPVRGCFAANRQLFGPYNFSFCLQRRGTYTVRGRGLSCDGRITWWTAGRDIHVDIHRTSCGRGLAWERATMDCRPSGRILGIILGNLRCTYHPTVRGERRQTFTARRI